jgi:hypothetical protein
MSERPTRRARPVTQAPASPITEPHTYQDKPPGRFAWEPEELTFDFDGDMEIDLNYLHIECQNHAAKFMKYAKESARSKKAAAFAEENVKTKRSQLVKAANEDPDGTLGKGIKPTAPNVEAYYRTHPDYIKVKAEWIEAVYYSDLCAGAVYAMQGRKLMLEMEVKLHGQQYYSVPEVENLSEAAKQFAELKTQDVERRIKERMNR